MRVSLETLLADSDLAMSQVFRDRMEQLVEMIREDDCRKTAAFQGFLNWWVSGGRRSLADDSKFPAITSDLRRHLEQMIKSAYVG